MAVGAERSSPGRAGERAPSGEGLGNTVLILLIWLLGASAFLLLLWGSKLTFLLDDWEFLIYRPGFNADAILEPHGPHISVAPVLVYKGLLATFGMDSALPFRVVSTALFLLSAVLLFTYLRRRVGEWPALAGTAVVLFLGAAAEDLLWSFQVGYFGSMSAGLGALLALERSQRRSDLLACALLTVSVLFSSLGLPFAAGAAVHVLWREDRWRRLYVVAVPVGVYALWWLGWGHTAESALSLSNLATTPAFVLDGIAAALASAFGLATPPAASVAGGLDWGRPLAVAAIVLALWRMWRLGRVPEWVWIVLAVAGAFWILAGLNQMPGRDPEASRYQYVGVILVFLVASELLRGTRARTGVTIAILAVAACSVVSNTYMLERSYQGWRSTSRLEKADLAALDIARGTVEPGFILSEDIADTAFVHIEAGPYFEARDEFGSPAYSPSELAEAVPPARFAADKVLSAALGLELAPVPAAALPAGPVEEAEAGPTGTVAVPAGRCVAVQPTAGGAPLLTLPPEGAAFRAGSQPIDEIKMNRFATSQFPIDFEQGLAPGKAAEVRIPPDRSAVPWKLELQSNGPTTVCGF